jgi:hypothetical protein
LIKLAEPAEITLSVITNWLPNCLFCSAALLCAVGDWLQGPYVYALYEKYGYSPAQIGQLFIAGFGSSLVVGTFVGALADRM